MHKLVFSIRNRQTSLDKISVSEVILKLKQKEAKEKLMIERQAEVKRILKEKEKYLKSFGHG